MKGMCSRNVVSKRGGLKLFLFALAMIALSACSNSSSGGASPFPPASSGMSVSAANLIFGDVELHSIKSLSVTITNISTDKITGLIAEVSDQYKSSTTCADKLDANASCSIEITFEPTSEGEKTGTLTISSANGGSLSVSLSGVGVAPTAFAIIKIYPNIHNSMSDSSFGKGNDGKLYAWGKGLNGRLGVGDKQDKTVPTLVRIPADVTSFDTFYLSSMSRFAKDNNGKLYAWGYNGDGRLGVGLNGDAIEPTAVVLPDGVNSFGDIYIGQSFILAVGDNNKLYAWGENSSGQLGIGNIDSQRIPTLVPYPQGVTKFLKIYTDSSSNTVLAEGDNGKFYGWGNNNHYQLGNPNIGMGAKNPTELGYPNGVNSYKKVVIAPNHVGAIGSDDKLYMWGRNDKSQLGRGSNGEIPAPVTNLPIGVTHFTDIYLGDSYTIAMGNDNKLYAWGDNNNNGTLGVNNEALITSVNPVAVIIPEAAYPLKEVRTADTYVFVIGNNNTIYSWGLNKGQSGVGNEDKLYAPTAVNLPQGVTSFTDLVLGGYHAFAKGNNGKIYAWGQNTYGQLGFGNNTITLEPTELVVTPQ